MGVVVRIRWHSKYAPARTDLALAIGSLLMPLALMAFTVGLWGFASELRWTEGFFIAEGLFAHWQIWLATAAVLLLLARVLLSYGGDEDAPA